MRKLKSLWARLLPAALICTCVGRAILPAHADTLAGDTLTVMLLCYSNPACNGATPTNPLLVAAAIPASATTFVVPVGTHGFSVNDSIAGGEHVVGSFSNNASATNTVWTIAFSVEQSNGSLAGFSSGGFIGFQMTATDASNNPLNVTIASTAGSNDGFALGDITGNGTSVLDLNFAGLTGSQFQVNDEAVLSLGDIEAGAAVPEPGTFLLLFTGGLVLLGQSWRRKVALAA